MTLKNLLIIEIAKLQAESKSTIGLRDSMNMIVETYELGYKNGLQTALELAEKDERKMALNELVKESQEMGLYETETKDS